MTKLEMLQGYGQSIWLDYLDRDLIRSGELQKWVDMGLRGVTSNPSIFDEAIRSSDAYQEQLKHLIKHSAKNIYEKLVVKDVQVAADIFRPVYDRTNKHDGFVSLEVNPELAYDTDGTIEEVKHLHKVVNRPNVMFKIPATQEGIPAIEHLLGEGININITLMFSMKQYEAVAKAYIAGLNHVGMNDGDVSAVASVASFFISRVDVKIDEWLDCMDNEALQGKMGIANAKLVYQRFTEIFNNQHWQSLAAQGAQPQRLLWASTSVKNPDYPETMYFDNLIGEYTVNTMPFRTLKAFMEDGTLEAHTVRNHLNEAEEQLKQLADLDIDLHEACEQLLREGVDKFRDSYRSLIGLLEGQRQEVAAEIRE